MQASGKLTYSRGARVALVLFFTALCALVLIPFVSMILTSFKPDNMLIRNGFNLSFDWEIMTLDNYRALFDGSNNYFVWYGNSLVLTLTQTVLTLFISAWVGYGFAYYKFKFKGLLFTCVLIVMMIPFEIMMLPMYKLIVSLKLTNSMWGIMLPYLANATTIFFFRQYLLGIPGDIVDAGRVDGCTEYGIFLRLILPVMKPAMASMAILVGMNTWNNYLWPLLVLNDSMKFTLPIGLNSLMSPYGNNYRLLVSGAVFSIIPIMILFLCAQKYFIAGMTAGSVKG